MSYLRGEPSELRRRIKTTSDVALASGAHDPLYAAVMKAAAAPFGAQAAKPYGENLTEEK